MAHGEESSWLDAVMILSDSKFQRDCDGAFHQFQICDLDAALSILMPLANLHWQSASLRKDSKSGAGVEDEVVGTTGYCNRFAKDSCA